MSFLWTNIKDVWFSLTKRGLVLTVKTIYAELRFDKKHGVDTSRRSGDQSDVEQRLKTTAVRHQGSNSVFFNLVFSKLNLDFANSVFIDFGSGKGRALVLAAEYGFKKIIGVEASEKLCRAAEENLARRRTITKKTINYDIINSDARAYKVEPEINVFYFFDPFHMSVFREVMDNIGKSLQSNPRKIWVVYLHPRGEDEILSPKYKLVDSKAHCYTVWTNTP